MENINYKVASCDVTLYRLYNIVAVLLYQLACLNYKYLV